MAPATSQPRTNSLAFAKTDCHTCAAQRRTCDRRRPQCSPCLDIGIKCGGFPMQLSWTRKKPAAPQGGRILNQAEDHFYLEPLSLKMASQTKDWERRHRSKAPQQFRFVASESSTRKRSRRHSSRPGPPRTSQGNEPPGRASLQRSTSPQIEVAEDLFSQDETPTSPGKSESLKH